MNILGLHLLARHGEAFGLEHAGVAAVPADHRGHVAGLGVGLGLAMAGPTEGRRSVPQTAAERQRRVPHPREGKSCAEIIAVSVSSCRVRV